MKTWKLFPVTLLPTLIETFPFAAIHFDGQVITNLQVFCKTANNLPVGYSNTIISAPTPIGFLLKVRNRLRSPHYEPLVLALWTMASLFG